MERNDEASSSCSVCSPSILKHCEGLADTTPSLSQCDQISQDFFDDFDNNDFVDDMVASLDAEKFDFDLFLPIREETPRTTKLHRGKSLYDCLSNAEEEEQQSWHLKCNPHQSDEVLSRSLRLIKKLRNPDKKLYQSPLKELPEVRFQFTSLNLSRGRLFFNYLPTDLVEDKEEKSFRDQGTQCDILKDIFANVAQNQQLCREGIQNMEGFPVTNTDSTMNTSSEETEMMQELAKNLPALVRTGEGETAETIDVSEKSEDMSEKSSSLSVPQIAEKTIRIAAWLQSIEKFSEGCSFCDESRQEKMPVSELLETHYIRKEIGRLKEFKKKLSETAILQESVVTDVSTAVREETNNIQERNGEMKLLTQVEEMELATNQEKECLSNNCEESHNADALKAKVYEFSNQGLILGEVPKDKPLGVILRNMMLEEEEQRKDQTDESVEYNCSSDILEEKRRKNVDKPWREIFVSNTEPPKKNHCNTDEMEKNKFLNQNLVSSKAHKGKTCSSHCEIMLEEEPKKKDQTDEPVEHHRSSADILEQNRTVNVDKSLQQAAEKPKKQFYFLCNNRTLGKEENEGRIVKVTQYDSDISVGSLDATLDQENNDESSEEDLDPSVVPEKRERVSLVSYDISSEEDEPSTKRRRKDLEVDKYRSSFCLRSSPKRNYFPIQTTAAVEEEEEECRRFVRSGPRLRLPLNKLF